MKIKDNILEQYKEAPSFIMVNDTDEKLHPIRIDLPPTPKLETISGYGLPAKDQIFQYEKTPPRLKKLEIECEGVISEMFRVLEKNQKVYREEIRWIKRQWYRRLYGYWFFNNGVPTFIDGWHYFYLNFFRIDVGQPRYYDRDRRWFLFAKYCYNDTKAYYRYSTKMPDGKIKYFCDLKKAKEFTDKNKLKLIDEETIVEFGRRICYGFNSLKGRRVGDSYKSLAIGLELITRSFESLCGIQSMDEITAKGLFIRIVSAWKKLPFFFMPMFDCSTNPKEEITFYAPSLRGAANNVVGNNLGLESKINFATTSDRSFYDSTKLLFYLSDEDGKVKGANINTQWNVPKQCLRQGSNIHGYSIHPSTAGEMSKGGENYYLLCESSRYEVRNDNGETMSGLYTWFSPAYDALEGFVDKHGYSVIETPTKEQSEFIGKSIGAKEYLLNERKMLIEKGDDDSMTKFRELQRLYPLEYDECFLSDDSDIGMPYEIINKRINELKFDSTATVRGNFVREISGDSSSRVLWVDDLENGRWISSKVLPTEETNLKYRDGDTWRPLRATRFKASADPFRLSKTGSRKMSNGGGAVFQFKDPTIDYPERDIKEWETNRYVCTYNYRPATTEQYAEDMLMMCEYYGCLMYPEVNVPLIIEHFRQRGHEGFLNYALDKKTGQRRKTAGFSSLVTSQQELFNGLRDYLQLHGHREQHIEILMECKQLKGIEDMTNHDLFVAAAGCLIDNDTSFEKAVEEYNITRNLEEYFPKIKY